MNLPLVQPAKPIHGSTIVIVTEACRTKNRQEIVEGVVSTKYRTSA
ncbi:MAG: hypothetical protein HEQ38_05045 [Gemmatimonas sp.]|nr:hypothetical protein [Gemmatimonas sp.]